MPIPTGSRRFEDLAREAGDILRANRRVGVSDWEGRPYDYTCPSAASYPFQWAWDSAFNAITLTHLDPGRAKAELTTLLSCVADDGFLPSVIFWDPSERERATREFGIPPASPYTSATVQPPVVGVALERVFERTKDLAWLRPALDAALRHFRWLERCRVDAHDLALIGQPDESGLDHSPKYDVALGLGGVKPADYLAGWSAAMADLKGRYPTRAGYRPASARPDPGFAWADVLFNTVYADGLLSLARLCRVAGRDGDAAACTSRADRTTAALLRETWNDELGLFLDRWGPSWAVAPCATITALMPLVLPDLDHHIADRLIADHLAEPARFWLPFGLPSVAASEPAFEPDLASGALFRGPSWVNLNWYLHRGLRQHGYRDLASELAARTAGMIRVGGWRECYEPFDGRGLAAPGFSWSALVVDILAAEGWIGAVASAS
jgi:hypothetical protein